MCNAQDQNGETQNIPEKVQNQKLANAKTHQHVLLCVGQAPPTWGSKHLKSLDVSLSQTGTGVLVRMVVVLVCLWVLFAGGEQEPSHAFSGFLCRAIAVEKELRERAEVSSGLLWVFFC